MSTAIDRLRTLVTAHGADASPTMRIAADVVAESDALRADRDRLAARVDELEQTIARYDEAEDFARLNALGREMVQREADLQTLVSRARDVPADRDAQGEAWAASCVGKREADPCPVDEETLERWNTYGINDSCRVVAWLTRQVMAMRERGE